jgi:hypothetical protein
MGRFLSAVISIALTVAASSARTANSVSISSGGWTVTADAAQGVLGIAYDNLGTVLKNVRLNLQAEGGPRALKDWSLETEGANQLSIKTGSSPKSVISIPPGGAAEHSNDRWLRCNCGRCGSQRNDGSRV